MENEIFPNSKGEAKLTYTTVDYSYSVHGSNKSHDIPITVLQVLIFGNDEYLCEVVHNEYLIEETTQTK